MRGSIVCGVDHSEQTGAAVELARELSARLGLRLVVAHVVTPTAAAGGLVGTATMHEHDPGPRLDAAKAFLESLVASERLGDVRIRCELGNAIGLLPLIADEEDAQLLVIGSRGRSPLRSAMLGSVSLGVARSAPCPVAVVPAGARIGRGYDGFETIVCGVDESAGARQALRVASCLANALDAGLILAHAAPVPLVPGASAAAEGQERLRHAEIERVEELLEQLAADEQISSSLRVRVAFGAAGGTLADIVEEEGASLVVVGSRGRGALKAALLGSVSSELASTSRTPVVIVPPNVATASTRSTGSRREPSGSSHRRAT